MNKKIKEFSLLEREIKLQKLLNMLEVFDWWNNLFTDIFNLMKELKENISEDLMISIYIILNETMENLTNENIWKSLNKIKEIKNKFIELKEKEEKERKKEKEENDNLLLQLY